MKGKLIKKEPDYYAFYNSEGIFISDTNGGSITNKLSLKNCQVIERGYDLEELADEFAKTKSSHSTFQNTHKRDFREGFQKALELMSNKKFSEEDVKLAIQFGSKDYEPQLDGRTERFIQSLQQTEWNVKIIEECLDKDCDGVDRKGDCITTDKPKLDAEGCLILKRI